MKAWSRHRLLILFIFGSSGAVWASGGDEAKTLYSYPLKHTPAKIQVQGASTLGEWDCSQNVISGTARTNISADKLWERISDLLEGHAVGVASTSADWKALDSQVVVAIDANGFDCDNGRMQRDLAEAIQADKYPSINYWFQRVDEMSVLQDEERGAYLELKVRGQLLFGGERRETIHVSYLWLGEGATIEVEGTLNLEMSDFGIKPPTAFLGLIRAKNDFQVRYRIKLETGRMVSEAGVAMETRDALPLMTRDQGITDSGLADVIW